MTTNAVESLLTRLQLAESIPAFKNAKIEKLNQLRQMTDEALTRLIPAADEREKLHQALNRNAEAPPRMGPPAIHSAPPARYADEGNDSRGRHPRGGYRGSMRGRGRGFGDRDRDHPEGAPNEREGDRPMRRGRGGPRTFEDHPEGPQHVPAGKDSYEEEITVPWDSVRLLLGNKAEKLNRINIMCLTSNSRIEKPDAFRTSFTFKVRGSKEGVQRAKAEIEKYVGITNAKNKEARFQYANHELDRNQAACRALALANVHNKGTPYELSEETLKRVIETFRFNKPPKISQFWSLSGIADKEKFETVAKVVKSFKGIQCVLFAEANRVVEMQKRANFTASAFGVTPQFLHREMAKEERMKALEAFKKGEVNDKGVVQRLLVTNNDYAKFARKVVIPYVNLVVHFAMPRTKEIYFLQTMCTGRHGLPGISWMFVLHGDSQQEREWEQSLPLQQFDEKEFEAAVSTLTYDTVAAPLTTEEADPPANWREQLAEEEKEKKEKKAAAATTAHAAPAAAPAPAPAAPAK